jgi:hypothetical protein
MSRHRGVSMSIPRTSWSFPPLGTGSSGPAGGGDTYFYDRWVFIGDGDIQYVGSVDQDEGVRYPPVVPE